MREKKAKLLESEKILQENDALQNNLEGASS